ncbi:MAG: radical SAM protein [Alphaproteobacteria bacterium]|nr:radical SAM protein [Alphaproteobacteria bacterium]
MQSSLSRLYDIFVQTLETHPDVAQPDKSTVIDSSHFYAAAGDDLIRLVLSDSTVTVVDAAIADQIKACKFAKYEKLFTGAVYAACAAQMLNGGDFLSAIKLAEKAADFNWLDLFPQDTILEANHRLDPQRPGLDSIKAWLKTRFCMYPFNWVEINDNNKVFSCCATFLPTPLCTFDDVDRDGADAVLKSPALQKIRASILDGSFRYCSKMHCTAITNKWLISREEGLNLVKNLGPWPQHMMLAYDRSCNLSCPSCRRDMIVVSKYEQDRFKVISEKLVEPLLPHVDNIYVTGSGDPFGSIHFRTLLQKYCRDAVKKEPRLFLETNGVLCDKKAWDDIGLYGHVKDVLVSIDAATEATYKIVRRGGDFQRLLKNMRFLSELRRNGDIPHLLQRFVVQALNFREMADFVRMGLDFGVDSVEFNLIRNWGTFTTEEFAHNNIGSTEHPDHQEFINILRDPIFDYPIVNLSGMQNLRPVGTKIEQPTHSPGMAVTVSEVLLRLYAVFLHTVVEHPAVVANGNIKDSAVFCETTAGIIDTLLQIPDCETLMHTIQNDAPADIPPQHVGSFIGVVFAACASRAAARGKIHMAQKLTDEAIIRNPFDTFIQSTVAHIRQMTSQQAV